MKPPSSCRASHRKSNSHAATAAERRAADPRIPDRRRGREADRGGRAQPLGSPRRHHDPGRLPPWAAASRAGRPALGPGRLRQGHPARPQGQAGHARHAPDHRRRDAGPAPAAARAGARGRRSCSRASAARRSPRRALPGLWSALARPPGSASRPTRTCCGTPAASRWPTRATIRGRCRPTSATRISSTRCATPSCRPIGSRISGGADCRLQELDGATRPLRLRCRRGMEATSGRGMEAGTRHRSRLVAHAG